MDIPVRIRIDISGRVQGVGFRYATLVKARSLNLTGWVRNRSDGSVSLEAQGPEQSVSQLLAWCHTGPERSVVHLVEHRFIVVRDETGFRIV